MVTRVRIIDFVWKLNKTLNCVLPFPMVNCRKGGRIVKLTFIVPMLKLYLIIAAVFVVIALIVAFIPGFQFTVTVCIAFAALMVLMYYLQKFPTPLTIGIFRTLWVLLILGILAASITLGFIIKAAHPAQIPACDHIIVLGAGVRGTVPSLSLQERINAAYDYLTANPKAIAVLSGGQGPGEDITEAACMYRELTQMGIDSKRLFLEEASTSTIENLMFSLNVIEEHTGSRPRTIGIVSSEYHIFRAKLFAKSLGLDPIGIPGKVSWFPLSLNYYPREVIAVWKYFVLGP